MRCSVSQAAKLAGVSVRTLRWYDEIGLLKPTEVTPAGYRFYDDEAMAVLQQILFYRELGVPLETAIRVCGENPARANGLWPRKGALRPGSDGDLILLDGEKNVDTVIARGRVMVRGGQVLVKGTFEE